MSWRPWVVFSSAILVVVSSGLIRIYRASVVVSRLGLVSAVSARFDSECPDVGAGSFPFEVDLEAFRASGGFVWVLSFGDFLFSKFDY